MESGTRQRVLVAALTVSLAGFGMWKTNEDLVLEAMIPTKGDVPTVGYGSTKYEDGTPVKMGDKVTPERAEILAFNLLTADAKFLQRSLPGVKLYQEEFDLYLDFIGQYGTGNWWKSSMRRELLAGNHKAACRSLLNWRFAAGYDCSTRINGHRNTRCWGVWERQLRRHNQCMELQ
jgi:GH24 family phage-related lysozyme (muramidase)